MTAYTFHLIAVALVVVFTIVEGSGIGCFVCTSINHSNDECEDSFNNTGKYYVENCWAPRDGRVGQFPGTQCIKMIAEDYKTGYTIVVRNCVVDNGGTNTETEIGRQSHCGWMRVLRYNGKEMRGCILSCGTDACNSAVTSAPTSYMMSSLFIAWILYHCRSVSGILSDCGS